MLTKIMSHRRKKLEMRLSNLTFRSASQKLALLLETLIDYFGEPVMGDIKINTLLTHQDLANLIGTTRQTVSGNIAALKHNNLLSVKRKNITIETLSRSKHYSERPSMRDPMHNGTSFKLSASRQMNKWLYATA